MAGHHRLRQDSRRPLFQVIQHSHHHLRQALRHQVRRYHLRRGRRLRKDMPAGRTTSRLSNTKMELSLPAVQCLLLKVQEVVRRQSPSHLLPRRRQSREISIGKSTRQSKELGALCRRMQSSRQQTHTAHPRIRRHLHLRARCRRHQASRRPIPIALVDQKSLQTFMLLSRHLGCRSDRNSR